MSATSRSCSAPKRPGCFRPASAAPPPMPTATCAGPSTAPASTSSRRRSSRPPWPSRRTRSCGSGRTCSIDLPPDSRAPWLWPAGAAGLALAALVAFGTDPGRLDWQPALAAAEPWRAWTAAFVHYSALHLAANVAGTLLVGALGVAAKLPVRSAIAWALAWPLGHAGLLLRPDLLHYGGLSGVLHAGVACAAVGLVAQGRGRRRAIGVAMLAVLVAKVLGEAPWGEALRRTAGWDIAIAPLAHASGLIAGVAVAAAGEALHRRSTTGAPPAPQHRPR